MPQMPFDVDVTSALTLAQLRVRIPDKPRVRSLQRWHKDGRKNVFTGETIRLPAKRNASGQLISSVAAYEHFINELNRKQKLKRPQPRYAQTMNLLNGIA